jgi:hypothetical protein
MAVDGETREMRAHQSSYGRFTFMMKWAAIMSLITALIVILIIAK